MPGGTTVPGGRTSFGLAGGGVCGGGGLGNSPGSGGVGVCGFGGVGRSPADGPGRAGGAGRVPGAGPGDGVALGGAAAPLEAGASHRADCANAAALKHRLRSSNTTFIAFTSGARFARRVQSDSRPPAACGCQSAPNTTLARSPCSLRSLRYLRARDGAQRNRTPARRHSVNGQCVCESLCAPESGPTTTCVARTASASAK